MSTTISDLIPDQHNANRGTEYGGHLLEKSLRELGAGRSILIDKNKNIIAGNKTAETAAAIGMEKVRIIETDGTEIIAVMRTDLDIDSKQGRELALADNQVGRVNLDFDPEVIGQLADDFAIELPEWGLDSFVTPKAKAEKEVDEQPTTHTCPSCGYAY
ncbi:hypothetical protein GCM10027577_19800 [Spirosoma fluminis]